MYSNEKQSVLCWWMLRPDSLAVPPLLGGQLQIKSWKCVNNVSLDRITSITSHSLPVQPDKFYNSNFSCGHLLAIACLSGSFYLVHKLKLDIMQRIDYGQLIKQSELPVSAFYRYWQRINSFKTVVPFFLFLVSKCETRITFSLDFVTKQ